MKASFKRDLARLQGDLIGLRRDIHAHPELAFHEQRTAGLVAERLKALGLEVRTGVAQTGVVALLRGGKPGKTVMARADIDALPVTELNDVDYRSRVPGAMHACGHDGHTAALVTAAALLAGHRDKLQGNVAFAFQPAEERFDGAQRMVQAGALENPRVDCFLALHLWNYLPVGKIGVRPGPLFASADEIEVVIKGKGGHGALPHQGVDAVAVAGQVVTALQTIVSREVPALQPAVVTIGSIHGGTAFNVLAEEVRMSGTVRCLDQDLRAMLLRRAEDVVRGICLAMRADYEFRTNYGPPPVVNDPGVSEIVRRAAAQVVGKENVVVVEPTMVGDDVSCFMERVPGCYFLVGSGNSQRGLVHPHHSPHFDFDEAALPLAAEAMAYAVLACLA